MPHPVDNHRVADGRPLRQDVETLSTGSLVNSADGQAWETLKAAGYEQGDRVQVGASTFGRNSSFSTTSGSWAVAADTSGKVFYDTSKFPSSVTLEGRGVIHTGSTMDTTGDFRIEFASENTPAVSESNSYTTITTGAVEITDRSAITANLAARSDGTNTISVYNASLIFEVVL